MLQGYMGVTEKDHQKHGQGIINNSRVQERFMENVHEKTSELMQKNGANKEEGKRVNPGVI